MTEGISALTMPLPSHLRLTAIKLRAQFQHLAPSRIWQRRQQDGSEIDLDAYLHFSTDRAIGHAASDGLYKDLRIGSRDLACLLLADLSLSTDTRANDYLPHLFGTGGYVVIHKPSQSPKELLLYAILTA